MWHDSVIRSRVSDLVVVPRVYLIHGFVNDLRREGVNRRTLSLVVGQDESLDVIFLARPLRTRTKNTRNCAYKTHKLKSCVWEERESVALVEHIVFLRQWMLIPNIVVHRRRRCRRCGAAN